MRMQQLCRACLVRLLLPLLRADDLGIEAREVLVDLVLAVVFGFLENESQHSRAHRWEKCNPLPLRPCMLAAIVPVRRNLARCGQRMPSSLR